MDSPKPACSSRSPAARLGAVKRRGGVHQPLRQRRRGQKACSEGVRGLRQPLGAVKRLGGARSAPGFTLLELAFVIGIFSLLVLFLASRETSLLQTRFDLARQDQAISDANSILDAALAFYRRPSSGNRWPHTVMMPAEISIEGLSDENFRDAAGNMLDPILAQLPLNVYTEDFTREPTVIPGINTLDDLEYMLSGWDTLPVWRTETPGVVGMMGSVMATPITDPAAKWLSLSFWVASKGRREANLIAANLPRGEVIEEHEVEAEERKFYSRVRASVLNPHDQAYLSKDWPGEATDLNFRKSSVMFDYEQAADSAANPRVALHFGEDMDGDYFKLVRLNMDGSVDPSKPGVEINFKDLTVPGDLTVDGMVEGDFDLDFEDGIFIGGMKLTRDDYCWTERRTRVRLAALRTRAYRVFMNRPVGILRYTQDAFCVGWVPP